MTEAEIAPPEPNRRERRARKAVQRKERKKLVKYLERRAKVAFKRTQTKIA